MDNKSGLISAISVMVIMAILVIMLYLCRISWQPDRPWPPEPEPYIELAQADEFIEPEVLPIPSNAPEDLDAAALTADYQDNPSQVAPESGTAMKTNPTPGTPAHETTTNNPSSVQQKASPKNTNPGNKTDDEKKQKEATQKRTRNEAANAFAKSKANGNANNRQGDQSTAGNPKGSAESAGPANSTATSAGVRYGSIGGGWQWPSYNVKIKTRHTGTVIVRIVIAADGTATAKAIGGETPAASDTKLCQQCAEIAVSRKFTRQASAGDPPDHANATLTFIFE